MTIVAVSDLNRFFSGRNEWGLHKIVCHVSGSNLKKSSEPNKFCYGSGSFVTLLDLLNYEHMSSDDSNATCESMLPTHQLLVSELHRGYG